MSTATTLNVRRLRTHFFTRSGELPAVDDVSFSLDRGEILGLVGESGSGKSVTGFSIMGLIDEHRVMVNPVLIGSGHPLFKTTSEKNLLKLVNVRRFDSGNVLLTYQPSQEPL